MNKKMLAGGVAQGNNSVTVRSIANKMVGKLKKVPAVESVSGFLTQAKHGWTMRKSAALLSMFLLCGGAGSMVGCGADDETQDIDLTGREIAYVNDSGELTTGVVSVDHGNTLDMGGFELSESEIVGFGDAAGSADSVTLAKGNHLDAYGDRFADIEYLHGMVEARYITIGDHEVTAALLGIFYGTTASGEQVRFPDEIGDNVWVLVRRSDYWYD